MIESHKTQIYMNRFSAMLGALVALYGQDEVIVFREDEQVKIQAREHVTETMRVNELVSLERLTRHINTFKQKERRDDCTRFQNRAQGES